MNSKEKKPTYWPPSTPYAPQLNIGAKKGHRYSIKGILKDAPELQHVEIQKEIQEKISKGLEEFYRVNKVHLELVEDPDDKLPPFKIR